MCVIHFVCDEWLWDVYSYMVHRFHIDRMTMYTVHTFIVTRLEFGMSSRVFPPVRLGLWTFLRVNTVCHACGSSQGRIITSCAKLHVSYTPSIG